MNSDKIYQNFNTIERGRCLYVSRADAEKFIESCKTNKIGILGFDGIYCRDGFTESPISLIADLSELKKDLSSSDFVTISCASSQKIMLEFPVDDDLYIDFVLDD